jgi:NADH-quinone oxidoreductase subunit J
MLATIPSASGETPVYDRTAREPLPAVVIGFALLAVLASAFFSPQTIERHRGISGWELAKVMPGRLTAARLEPILRNDEKNFGTVDRVLGVDVEARTITVAADSVGQGAARTIQLTDDLANEVIGNLDRIGLNLFESHTLGIELAGVILLLSMVGAIVIAKKKVPHEEQATGS